MDTRVLRDQLQAQWHDGGLRQEKQVRVCNAYAHNGAMGIRLIQSRGAEAVDEEPLQYKACRDFRFSIEAEDNIEFALGGAVLGVFVVADLPQSGGMLLLVVRRDPNDDSMATFYSHEFANVHSPQLAVIDAYGGETISALALRGPDSTSQDLRFGSVLRLGPGRYELETIRRHEAISSEHFDARDGLTYVVFRVGAKHSPGFPEAIVVFPSVSDERKLQSFARASSSISLSLFGLITGVSCVW